MIFEQLRKIQQKDRTSVLQNERKNQKKELEHSGEICRCRDAIEQNGVYKQKGLNVMHKNANKIKQSKLRGNN